jgi:hypothetical protein
MNWSKPCIIVLTFLSILSSISSMSLADAGQKVTIKDWTGRGFPPDLVNYDIALPAGGAQSVRVTDATGKVVPSQVTPTTNGRATLSFVTDLPANGQVTFSIQTDGQPVAVMPMVTSQVDGKTLIISNQSLAVRLPAIGEQRFTTPVPASTLPAPVLAFRGADGTWRGKGTINHDRAVSLMRVTQTATGPVYHETTYRLEYQQKYQLKYQLKYKMNYQPMNQLKH